MLLVCFLFRILRTCPIELLLNVKFRISQGQVRFLENELMSGRVAGTLLFCEYLLGSVLSAYRRVLPSASHHPTSHFTAVTRKLLHDFKTEVLIDVT